jgi:hypothetical protein
MACSAAGKEASTGPGLGPVALEKDKKGQERIMLSSKTQITFYALEKV